MAISFLMSMLIRNVLYYMVFRFPALQMVIVFAVMLAVCVIVPVTAYWSVARESVAERLKGQD